MTRMLGILFLNKAKICTKKIAHKCFGVNGSLLSGVKWGIIWRALKLLFWTDTCAFCYLCRAYHGLCIYHWGVTPDGKGASWIQHPLGKITVKLDLFFPKITLSIVPYSKCLICRNTISECELPYNLTNEYHKLWSFLQINHHKVIGVLDL